MNDQNLQRDLNDLIDGTATPEQVARLKRIFADDPAIADLYREIRDVDQLLREAPREFPPGDLKEEILAAIRTQRKTEPDRGGWFQSIRSALARWPAVGLAYSFSAGVVVGVLALWLIPGIGPASRLDHPDRVSGTLMRDGQGKNGQATIFYSGGKIAVKASPSPEGHDLRLSVDGPGRVDVTLKGVASPDSVIRLEVNAAGEVRQHEIRLTAPAGH